MEIGFPSVMYDGSRKIFEDNITVTRKVTEFCHKKGLCVQGELGSVPYLGETGMGDIDWDKYMTNPDQAADFVCRTGIDSLAVAIGNAHGFFKERSVPDYDRLEKIHEKFRDYVLANRQQLDIDKVATGEHWLARDAFDLRLVDTLKTSDEYLNDKMTVCNVYKIAIHAKQTLVAKLLRPATKLLHPWA